MASSKDQYRGQPRQRPELTEEQKKAIRLWVWGEEQEDGSTHYIDTKSELAQKVGVHKSNISRWFNEFPLFAEELDRQTALRNAQDDKFYQRMRARAQLVLQKNLNAPYARDSTAAALAILSRCGDVDGVRVEVAQADADRVIRGGFGRSGGDV